MDMDRIFSKESVNWNLRNEEYAQLLDPLQMLAKKTVDEHFRYVLDNTFVRSIQVSHTTRFLKDPILMKK